MRRCPRLTLLCSVVLAAALLAGCRASSSSNGRATSAGGQVGATSSVTAPAPSTTSSTSLTGAARTASAAVATERVAAGCPPPLQPDGLDGGARFDSLRMVSATKGFAVDDTALFVTDDGHSWSRRYGGPDPMFSIEAVDADHAWAVGQQIVLATTDGGRTWEPLGEPEAGMLRAVDFVDARNGWGVTGHHVLRTADGGRNWRIVDPPCGGEAVCFTAPDDGWAAIGTDVYRTTDGGEHWQAAFTVPTDDLTHGFNAQSVHAAQLRCARPGVAWVTFVGSASGSHLAWAAYRGTADGRWTPMMKEAEAGPTTVQAPAGGTYPAPMAALGPDSAVYVTFSPLASPPGGLTLRAATAAGRRLGPPLPVRGLFSASGISFLTPQLGWLIGARSGPAPVDAILATTDGGHTWTEQSVVIR